MFFRTYAFFILIFNISLSSCIEKRRVISVVCEECANGNYEIKWDIYPQPNNARVTIFTSDNDSVFPAQKSVVARSDDYIKVVDCSESESRKYFKLKVDGTSSGVISNRFFVFDSIQNFRDLGGYYTTDNRQVKWGKLFRSGSLSLASERDKQRIAKLNIVTNININMQFGDAEVSNPLDVANYFRLPIGQSGFELIVPKIQKNCFLRGDAVLFMQDFYKDIIENFTPELTRFFDYLVDESNYPIVYNCYFGKAQTGLATYFILRILGVSDELIEEDYLYSNRGIDKHKLGLKVDSLTESGQEALTLITNTDISYLRFALGCIRKKFTSVDRYMEKELGITNKKKQILRQILLYPENNK